MVVTQKANLKLAERPKVDPVIVRAEATCAPSALFSRPFARRSPNRHRTETR